VPEENIKIFTPKNIQGSETDYFIFNAESIKSFDTFRDKAKALYTFTTRSKIGSIIIDSEIENGRSFIEKTLHIRNGQKSITTQVFEPLTDSITKKAKEDRKKRLTELLKGKDELSPEGNFK